MKLELRNVRNIKSGIIEIKENELNIKYGMNGVGKSSIVKAIEYNISRDRQLFQELVPFYDQNLKPEIKGLDVIESVEIFNEEFVNNFLFKEDALIENSFEVFVKNEEYDKSVLEVENALNSLSERFKVDHRIANILKNLDDLISSTAYKKDGLLDRRSVLHRGMERGNIIENVPPKLIEFEDLLGFPDWVDWHLKGKKYQEKIKCCAYCSNSIDEENQNKIDLINEHYNKNSISALNKIISVFDGLEGTIKNEAIEKVNSIRLKKAVLQDEEQRFIVTLNKEAAQLTEKLRVLNNLNYFTLKDLEIKDLENTLESYKIDATKYPNIMGTKVKGLIEDVNGDISNIIIEINALKGVVARLKSDLRTIISGKVNDINEFLDLSGFKYKVDIPSDDPSYRIILRPTENESMKIMNPRKSLSFGERNTFALVLFVHKVLKTQPELIILDDPVSSFDKNKKFSIMYYLFSKESKLRNKTVLLLTHDYEPILDFVKILPSSYKSNSKYVSNLNGLLEEQSISKEDIMSFFEITINNATSHQNNILKLIHLRRYYEIKRYSCKISECAFQYISSLLHRRPQASNIDDSLLDDEIVIQAEKELEKYIDNISYNLLYDEIKDDSKLIFEYEKSKNHYDKLHLFRLLCNGNDVDVDKPIQKFINSTYHPEGEYIYELNPLKFERIPISIIRECDRYINEIKDNIN